MPSSDDDAVVHPGWVVVEWLNKSNRSQVWLARQLGLSPKHVNQILKGHALWSLQIALNLEEITGIPAIRLMRMRVEYEIDQAKRQRSQP